MYHLFTTFKSWLGIGPKTSCSLSKRTITKPPGPVLFILFQEMGEPSHMDDCGNRMEPWLCQLPKKGSYEQCQPKNQSYEQTSSFLTLSPLIKIMEHSNATLWTNSNSEFWDFYQFCRENPKNLFTFSNSSYPHQRAPMGALCSGS